MLLLKPCLGFHFLPSGLNQHLDVFAKNGIDQDAFDSVEGNRLQDNPGVMGDFPKLRIKLPPYLVGGTIPRPPHIQGQLGEGVNPLNSRRMKICHRGRPPFVGLLTLFQTAQVLSSFIPSLSPHPDHVDHHNHGCCHRYHGRKYAPDNIRSGRQVWPSK